MNIYTLHQGSAPLLISLPHNGTLIPDALKPRLTAPALRTPDTDWHVARLYDFARELGASILVPQYSRYVVDLNRPPDGVALYPGQSETGLCPLTTFARTPVYLAGQEPSAEEIGERVSTYWRPYHAALATELARLQAQHGRAVLWEGHSIRSVVPMFFEGKLPDFNLGTAAGQSCSAPLQQRLVDVLTGQGDFNWVANGRFKGGYITRQYGRPEAGIDAIQLEIAQHTYMDEDNFAYMPQYALRTQALIRPLLLACLR